MNPFVSNLAVRLPCWDTADAEIKVLFAENPELPRIHSFKPG